MTISCGSGLQERGWDTNTMTKASPDTPVSQLKLFVGFHLTAILEEVGKGVSWQPEGPASLASIKHVHYIQTKVTLQPLYVIVSTVQHLCVSV